MGVREFGTLHTQYGEVPADRVAGSRISIGERSSTCRCHRPWFGTAACRPRMNVPATRIIPAGPGSLSWRSGEGRMRAGGQVATGGDGQGLPMATIANSNWTRGAALPLDCAVHPLQTRRCRETENRATNAQGVASGKPERHPGRGSRRIRFRAPPPDPGSGFRDTALAPMTAPRTGSRARRSRSRSAAGAPVPRLISACRTWTTPIRRWRGRSEPKTPEKSMVCAVTGPVQGRYPPPSFTLDSCCYRA